MPQLQALPSPLLSKTPIRLTRLTLDWTVRDSKPALTCMEEQAETGARSAEQDGEFSQKARKA